MKILKDIRKNSILLIIMTTVILFILLKDNFYDITKILSNMNILFLLLAIVAYLISLILKAYITYLSIENKNKVSFKEAIKHNIITQFFNGITPFSTGGQPMEIYMLTEHDINIGQATSITIENFIFYQIALVIYGIIVVIYNSIFKLFPEAPMLRKFVLLGFIINTLVAILLVIITISEKATKKIANILIEISSSLKIIKNKEKVKDKVEIKLKEFHISAKRLREKKSLFIKGVFINFLSLTFLYLVPLFISYGFNDFQSINALDAITASAYIYIIGSFVPIPGASGGIEYGFIKFFGNFFKTAPLNALLLVWRFITYYLGMLIGALLFCLEKKGD